MWQGSVSTIVAVDWGLSACRAWLVGNDGQVEAEKHGGPGVLKVADRAFGPALAQFLGDWRRDGRPIVLAGMIGSRQGWREAPYVTAPTDAAQLAGALVPIESGIWLVPGVSCRRADGAPEVMRGEEAQIFGADIADGMCCMPGTHSKWAEIRGGILRAWTTYVTGELFAMLSTQGTLAAMLAPGPQDDSAFDLGCTAAEREGHVLLADLFTVRTKGLFDELPRPSLASYLSGMLIGNEVGAALAAAPTLPITLIGAGPLVRLYARALARRGVDASILGEAVAARGLHRIWAARRSQP